MLAVAVLAAGKGTRMKSTLPKVLQLLGGKPLVERVLDATDCLNADRRLVIIGYGREQVRQALATYPRIEFVEQVEQLGTGHAIQQLMPPLQGFSGELVVLTGDSPLMRPETLQQLVNVHRQRQAKATVLTALLADPTGYGRVFCDDSMGIECIVEHRDCTPEQRQNNRISTGVYCFDWEALATALPQLTCNNSQKEYYLTEVFDYMSDVVATDLADPEESLGINDRMQLAHAYDVLQRRLRHKWMSLGVTMVLPETITIDDEVELAPNVILEPNTHLRGKTVIAAGSVIGPSSMITNGVIGADSQVSFSVVEDSTVGDNCRVGPYAHIRGESLVGTGCRLGNFVELKKAVIGERTNAAHLSYLGDVTIGTKANIGAGTIIANYDGFKKHPTILGNRVKTGSNSVIVAPSVIADNTVIGAGSVVKGEIPPNALVIVRPEQVVKPDYYDETGRKKSV